MNALPNPQLPTPQLPTPQLPNPQLPTPRLPTLLLSTPLLLAPAGAAAREPVRIAAAASVAAALEEAVASWSADTGVPVQRNVASSGRLARQILSGAPHDLFLSANLQWVRALDEAGRLDEARPLLGNRIVAVARDPDRAWPPQLGPDERFAMGDPDAVPAGAYGREALQATGLWPDLAPRLVPTADTLAAVQLARRGEVAFAIGYATDSRNVHALHVIHTIDRRHHRPVRYPLAVLRGASPAARRLGQWLHGPDAAALFERHGFEVLVHTPPAVPPESDAPSPAAAPESLWRPLWLSLQVAFCCTLAVALPGILLGWYLARHRGPWQTALEAILHAPLVLPPVVTGYLLLLALGREGWLGRHLHHWFGVAFTFQLAGAVLAAAIMATPLLVRAVKVAVELVDPGLEQAAELMGASQARTLVTVTLPLAMPGILCGLVLAFARCLGEFGATITFAGNIAGRTRTLSLAIFTALQRPGQEGAATRLLMVSLALCLASLAASELLAHRMRKGVR